MARARGVTLKSQRDASAKATYEEAMMDEPRTPPPRAPSADDKGDARREDAEATAMELTLVDA